MPGRPTGSGEVRASRESDELLTGINVTPLIDVVLVLLVVLMVTCAALAAKVIAVEPAGVVETEENVPRVLTISIDERRQLYADAEPIDWAELSARARRFAREEPGGHATLMVDRRVPHESFVRALDVLRAAGVRRYSLAIPPD